MSWHPKDYADYSFSEYTPSEQPEKAAYTDPRFYQAGKTPQPVPPAPSAPGPYETVRIDEYKGPASLDRFSTEAQSERQEEARDGEADTTDKRKKGLAELGGVGVALGVVFKFGLASVSALVSVFIYAKLFGLGFGLGLVALLFIHEMGHAVVMKIKGIPVGGMIFIPMLGAAVFMRRMPGNAKDEAEVGIAGPVAGALASLVCLFIALSSPPASAALWAALAYFGFFLNLFNLIPIVPFDGGRVLGAIDRRIWFVGFIALIAVQIWELATNNFSIWLLIFIIMAATEFWTRRRGANTPQSQAYYTVARGERILIGLAYFGLIAVLILGMTAAHGLMGVVQ